MDSFPNRVGSIIYTPVDPLATTIVAMIEAIIVFVDRIEVVDVDVIAVGAKVLCEEIVSDVIEDDGNIEYVHVESEYPKILLCVDATQEDVNQNGKGLGEGGSGDQGGHIFKKISLPDST